MTKYVTMEELTEKMRAVNEAAYFPESAKGYERLKADGKLNARQRLDVLLDPGSFVELGRLAQSTQHEFGMDRKKVPGDGIVSDTVPLTAAWSACTPKTARYWGDRWASSTGA